jgi:hypothetical protein
MQGSMRVLPWAHTHAHAGSSRSSSTGSSRRQTTLRTRPSSEPPTLPGASVRSMPPRDSTDSSTAQHSTAQHSVQPPHLARPLGAQYVAEGQLRLAQLLQQVVRQHLQLAQVRATVADLQLVEERLQGGGVEACGGWGWGGGRVCQCWCGGAVFGVVGSGEESLQGGGVKAFSFFGGGGGGLQCTGSAVGDGLEHRQVGAGPAVAVGSRGRGERQVLTCVQGVAAGWLSLPACLHAVQRSRRQCARLGRGAHARAWGLLWQRAAGAHLLRRMRR